CQVLSSIQGTVTINYPDPQGEYITFDAWVRSVLNANFYVSKRGSSLMLAASSGMDDTAPLLYGGGAVYVPQGGSLLVEGNDIVEFSNNNAANDGGAIFGENGSTITISGNPTVSFIQNTAGENGGAIAVYDNCLVSVTGNGSVVFDGNSAQQVGGAIYGGYGSTVSLHGNGEVSFLRNAPGAIYAENIGIEANDSVTFAENDQAGAIYGGEAIDIANNGSVSFSTNWSYENGGAIYGWDTASIALRGNSSVEFAENTATQRGGAVYGADIAIANNGSVVFSGNSAAGEQYGDFVVTLDDFRKGKKEFHIMGLAESVIVPEYNLPQADGALENSVYCKGYANFAGLECDCTFMYRTDELYHENGEPAMGWLYITFDSLDPTSSPSTLAALGQDPQGSGLVGSAVEIQFNFTTLECQVLSSIQGTVTINYPDPLGEYITFDAWTRSVMNANFFISKKNAASYLMAASSGMDDTTPLLYGGGAVYVPQGGSVRIEGNDHVEFRNNWISSGDTYRLMGLCVEGDDLVLAAGAGQDITFYDALYAKSANGALQVSFNADYRDKGNVLREATGDIVFSGKYAEQDLRALKRYYTQEELEASLTSEVYGTTNLYGGRLRIEDGAVYKGNGINVAGGSNATLRLANGTLNQAGYAVSLASGTTLELQGVNDITASTLNLQGGSRLSFVVGSENLNASCLYLDGDLVRSGKITLSLAGDGTLKAGSEYRLLTLGSGDTPSSWNWNYVTISGMSAGRDDFRWQEGTLYYTYTRAPEEIDFPAGGTWANGAGNYNDGDFVTFTNCGTVTVVGTVIPGGMTVQGGSGTTWSGSGTTWSGSGTVAGAATLVKTGSGTLTINTANTYTGGTTISGGTLRIGNKAALGTGAVQLSGGTLEVAASGFSNTISASANSAITVTSGNTLTLKNAISNTGTLTLKGEFNASALALSDGVTTHVDVKGKTGASGFSRTGGRSVTIVSGGTTIGRDATITHSGLKPGETLTLGSDGRATTGQGSVDYSTYLLTGTDTASVSDIEKAAKEHGATLNGITVPGGTLTVDATTDKVNVSGGEITLVEGGLLTVPKAGALEYSTVTLEGGTLNVNGKDISQCDVVATGPSTVEAGAGGKVRDLAVRTGGTSGQNGELYFADELTLGGTLNVGSFTLEQGDIVGDGIIKVTGSAVVRHGYVGCDLEGAMGAKLVKEGADTRVELGGETTFTGGVAVKEGSLALLHGSGLSADVTVYNGAALLIDKKVKVAGDIALQGGATIRLRPGSAYTLGRELTAYGAEFRGSLSTASGASVTLGAGGAALTVSGNVSLGGGNIVYGSASATLAVDGTLTLQSNTSITGNWAVGGPYTIIQATSVETGNKNLNTFFNLAQTNYTLTATKTSITLQKKAGAKAAALQSLAGSTVPAMGGEAVEAPVTETLVQGVAETLVQADWGTVHAGRAFAGTLNGRHQSLRAICNGKSAVWVNAMGSRTRQSSAHGHAGADHDLYGGVFGVEFNAGAHGAAGLAIGHSWNRVNTFGMNRVKQDSQHAGAFARARLASQGANNLWLEASAAYGKTESRGALGAARERWTQNGCTLNLHANDVWQVSGESAVNFFAGLEYIATDSGTFDSLRSGSVQNLRGELGAGVTRTVGRGMVYAEAALLGDMVRHNPQADLGAGYRGANPGRIGGSISVGGAYAINAHWSVNASYTFEGVKHNNSHNAGVGATFRF
ncbi:MAG: autotransporter-associated beta strand repeat-containing protein, partial [Akkermansia sp.]|nr:autotransporter-associated beta strand repeat-containing protein [Akkermansia sp.]